MKSISTPEELGVGHLSKVLTIMPHPDDEAVFISGLLQKLAQSGTPTRLITCTNGEKSTLRYGLSTDQDLATVRVKELTRATQRLGVTDLETWNFPDGGLEDQSKQLKVKITSTITQYSPSHILVLEPDGIYGHPDHIALTKVVLRCASKITIIFATVSPSFKFPSARKMAKKKIIKPIHPEFKLALTVKETFTKIQVIRTHRSQFRISPIHPETLIYFQINDMLRHEYYCYQQTKK